MGTIIHVDSASSQHGRGVSSASAVYEHAAFFDAGHAGMLWSVFAARLAGRPAMRPARIVRRDGLVGRAVYDRGEAPITEALPEVPAAVLLYDGPDRATARTPVLAFDLDAKARIGGSPAGRAAAGRDADLIEAAVAGAGGSCIVSAGPTGGRHVWIPLVEPLPLAHAAALAHALRAVCPTLDPAPLGNAVSGCLRPPGSPHAAGGHQALLTAVPDALRSLDVRNSGAVLDALWALVPAAAGPAARADPDLAHRPGPGGLPQRWQDLAAAGPRPGEYRGDASLARWYITLAAVRAGWSADQWVAAVGGWPWLAEQLASPRRLALARAEFEKAAARWRRTGTVQKPDTSRELLHGGGGAGSGSITTPGHEDIHLRLRRTRTWLQNEMRSGRLSPAVAAVARAVLLFAHATESPRIQVGVRALAVAAAVSRTTAGEALWALEAVGLVSRVGRGVARGADVWEIALDLGGALPPASGRIWATRPVFRVVGGHGAAEVYEALSVAAAPLSSRALAGMLGRSPTTVTEHLRALAVVGLAEGGGRAGWAVGPACPEELAVRLGACELVEEQVATYRAERAAWWAWLEARGLGPSGGPAPAPGQIVLLPDARRADPAARGDRAGPDAMAAAVRLIREVFGAELVTTG